MKSSRLVSLALAVAAAVCSGVHAAVERAAQAVYAGASYLFSLVWPAPVAAQADVDGEPAPKIQMQRAMAYRQRRLVRRERVIRQPSYMWCPSV
jgi:alpha-galactosidase